MPMYQDKIVGCRCRDHYEGFASKDAPKNFPPDLQIEPQHLTIDVFVDVANRALEGTVTHRVLGRADGADTLVLDAVGFEIASVTDLAGRDLRHDYDGKKLTIRWADGLTRGEEREVAVAYRVEHPVSGLFFSSADDAYPEGARYAATDHETERARHWLPCVDLPNVRCTLEFKLRADAAYEILANGALQGITDHDDGTKTAHWKLDWPCPSYITCFALGDFTRAEDGEFKGIPIAYFGAHSVSEEDLLRSFGRTGEMLGWLTELLGQDFPYPKYYQFALPGFGGAMENISLVSWDDVFVLDEGLMREEWGWLVDQVNIHEMAHSYFGDAIVCRDFSHAWLKESWATYTETCWLEHKYGADEQHYDLFRNRRAYFQEADGSYKRAIVTATFDSSWQMYDRHLYPGGGARLHMLRKVLGDDVFWEGVRTYVARFMGKTVETSDFRRVLEEVSGRSLVRFFDQWILSPGYPALKASFSYDSDKKLGTYTLEQTQDEDAFVMDIELGWRDAEGVDHITSVSMDSKKVHRTVSMAEKPEFVRVDPNNHLVIKLDFEQDADPLKAQLTGAADIVGRIQAAGLLIKTGTRKNFDAVAAAYKAEPFWGVRQEMATALGGANHNHALAILIDLLTHESDDKVKLALVRALGKYRDSSARDALLSNLGALPPRATMAAYEELGRQRGDADFATLEAAASAPTHLAFGESGALRGLANTRVAAAAETLTKFTTYGQAPHRARAAAAGALGGLSRHLPEHQRPGIEERLVDLLRDPIDRVRAAAARGLVAAGATGARGALERYRATLPHQEQVDLDESLQGLAKPGEPGVKALETKLDAMTKKVRDLTDTLAKLEARLDAND